MKNGQKKAQNGEKKHTFFQKMRIFLHFFEYNYLLNHMEVEK